MAPLERETEISGQRLAAWRAGLPTLANDRVVLRELRVLDAASLYRVTCCPDVSRYTWPAPSGAGLLLDYAFRVVGVHRIEARAAVDNVRSNAALRRLSAHREGTLRAASVCDGKLVDQHLWAIVRGLDGEWPPTPRECQP